MHHFGLMHIHPSLDEAAHFDHVGSGALLEVSASERLLKVAHEITVGDTFLGCVSVW